MDIADRKNAKGLFAGGTLSVAASLLVGVFAYLVRRFLASSLSVEDYASVYALMALGMLAVSIFRFGTAEAVLFVLSGLKDPAGPEGRRLFSGVCLWNAAVFAIITFAAALFLIAGGRPAGVELPLPTLLLFLPFLFLSAFEGIFGNAFNALGAFGWQYGIQVLKMGLMFVGAVLVCGMPERAVLAFNVPLLIIFLLSCVGLRRLFCADAVRGSWAREIREQAPRCLCLWLFSFNPVIFSELATAVLAGASSLSEVAFFNIAVPAAMIIRSFYCVAMVFVPFAGAMKNSGDYRKLALCIRISAAATVAAGLLLIPVFALFGRMLICLLFGEKYADASLSAFLLSEAMVVAFSGQMNINTLNTLGKERLSALLSLLTAALAVAIYIPLARFHGAAGVAAGCFAVAAAWSIVSYVLLMRQLRRIARP